MTYQYPLRVIGESLFLEHIKIRGEEEEAKLSENNV